MSELVQIFDYIGPTYTAVFMWLIAIFGGADLVCIFFVIRSMVYEVCSTIKSIKNRNDSDADSDGSETVD